MKAKNKVIQSIIMGTVAAILFIGDTEALGETILVDIAPCSDIGIGNPFCTIQEAVDAAVPGDTIEMGIIYDSAQERGYPLLFGL